MDMKTSVGLEAKCLKEMARTKVLHVELSWVEIKVGDGGVLANCYMD